MIPTDEQQIFLDTILTLVNKKQVGYVSLCAPAGTGKTYCIDKLNSMLWREYSVTILCPTHKSKQLFKVARTIHSEFGASISYAEDGEKRFLTNDMCLLCEHPFDSKEPMLTYEHILTCKATTQDHKVDRTYKIYLVDEGSMINVSMLNRFNMLSCFNLVIFFSDNYQLPPIGFDQSPIYELGKGRPLLHTFTLTQNMRAKTDNVRQSCDMFRDAIQTGRQPRCYDKMDLDEQNIKKYFDPNNTSDSIILSWTNHEKTRWNDIIRRTLFLNNSTSSVPCEYYIGENVMFKGYRSQEQLESLFGLRPECSRPSEFQYLDTLYSSCLEQIKSNPRIKILSGISSYTYHTSDIFQISRLDSFTINIPSVSKSTKSGEPRLYPIDTWIIQNQNEHTFLRVKNTSMKKFNELKKEYANHIKNLKIDKNGLPRKHHWRMFYQIFEMLNADLEYTYSLTVHMAQGSGWVNVFVNILNIRRATYQGTLFCNKLSYTAVSRARSNVYFINN